MFSNAGHEFWGLIDLVQYMGCIAIPSNGGSKLESSNRNFSLESTTIHWIYLVQRCIAVPLQVLLPKVPLPRVMKALFSRSECARGCRRFTFSTGPMKLGSRQGGSLFAGGRADGIPYPGMAQALTLETALANVGIWFIGKVYVLLMLKFSITTGMSTVEHML